MVAKVICGKSIKGAIGYNENKVTEAVASCIHSNKFGMEVEELSIHEKLNRFRMLMDLNKKVKTNTVHISLNFDSSDRLTRDNLRLISDRYMELLGFSAQPYLVYQHRDAAHPHVHIVSTNITSEGKRIDLHNIGKVKSENARKAIEAEFNLVKAERMNKSAAINPILAKASYGKTETKRAISNVVREVTRTYKFTSLPELNAALKQFNVFADRGYEGTRMFARKGLVYSILDRDGNKVGVPVKSSSIYGGPTLNFLEKQFGLNEVLRKSFAGDLKRKIDDAIIKYEAKDFKQLKNILARFNVIPVLRQNEEEKIYGITYVDNDTRVVFNGSDLGKEYSVMGISERMKSSPMVQGQLLEQKHQEVSESQSNHMDSLETPAWLKALMDAQKNDHSNLNQFKKKKKPKPKGRSL